MYCTIKRLSNLTGLTTCFPCHMKLQLPVVLPDVSYATPASVQFIGGQYQGHYHKACHNKGRKLEGRKFFHHCLALTPSAAVAGP